MSVRGLEAGQKPALLINECQRGTTDPAIAHFASLAEHAASRGVMPRIKVLAQTCRELGVPVIHNIVEMRKDGGGWFSNCLLASWAAKPGSNFEGTPAAEIHPDLTPADSDYIIKRIHGLSAFYGTELESVLRSIRVDTVIMAGVSTNIMIPGSSLEAVNRGFQVIVPEDCTAGASPEIHDFQMRETLRLLATVTTAKDLTAALKERLWEKTA